MADSSRSSSSKRVQDLLPSFKPSYVYLISLFLCGILVWNSLEERGNKRTVLETTSPREISKRSGFANGYFLGKSFISIEEPRVTPFEWKSMQDDSKMLHYPSGKNDLVTWQCKFLVEGLPSSSVFFLVRRIAQLWQSGSSIILTRGE